MKWTGLWNQVPLGYVFSFLASASDHRQVWPACEVLDKSLHQSVSLSVPSYWQLHSSERKSSFLSVAWLGKD